jgi:hypothetical protein
MWNVEGAIFDKYYLAYEYASDLSTRESREVEILKEGNTKGIKIWTNRPMVNNY